jgi:hypothetical protein
VKPAVRSLRSREEYNAKLARREEEVGEEFALVWQPKQPKNSDWGSLRFKETRRSSVFGISRPEKMGEGK